MKSNGGYASRLTTSLALAALSLTALLTTSCDTSSDNNSGVETTSREGTNMKELLRDTAFENGFHLLTPATTNGRAYSGDLNYGGKAKGEPVWEMAQWWTPFDFINATFTEENGVFTYQNASRSTVINPAERSMEMNLNSDTEYQELYGHPRTGTETWSHFLIEQNLAEPIHVQKAKHIYVHLDFTIEKSKDCAPGQAVPCSQITWYFTITDVKNGDAAYESGDNDFFWFGLPLFDSRFPKQEGYKHVDSGFEGATNKLIYNIGSDDIFRETVEVGKPMSIDLDILPFIKKAYVYGFERGAMPNSEWADLVLNYMNLGWELPGSFDVRFKIANISIQYEEK